MPPLFGSDDGDRPSIRAVAKRAKKAADPVESADLYAQAGELAIESGKVKKAISMFRNALEKQPLHTRASDLLEGLLRERGELPLVHEELRRRIIVLTRAGDDSRHLAQQHLRLAKLEEQLELHEQALVNYDRTFVLDPTQVAAAEAGRRLALKAEMWAEACAILERETVVVSGRDERARLLHEHALLKRDRLGNVDEALGLLSRAKKSDPVNVGIRRELSRTLVIRAEKSDDEDAASRDRNKAADVLCEVVEMVAQDERLACVEAALDIAPEHLDALRLLEELVPDDMDRLLDRWAGHVEAFPDGPISDELRERLGNGHREAGRREEAIRWFGELGRAGDVEAALSVLDLHIGAGRSSDAQIWAEVALERSPEDEQLTIMRRIFGSFRTEDPEEAYARARDIVRLDPTDADALEFCILACEAAKKWSEMADLLSEVTLRPEIDDESRSDLLAVRARLEEKQLKNVTAALGTWRDIEQLAEGDRVARARKQRTRLAEIAGEWDELVLLLDERADSVEERVERIETFRKLAEVHRDERDDPERAARAFLGMLDASADVGEVLDDLAEMLRRSGPDSDVIVSASSYADRSPDVNARVLFRMLGRLFDEWEDPEKAFHAWSRVHEHADTDVEANERLVATAIATDRHERAITVLSERVALASAELEIDLHRQIAAVAGDHLADFDRAADALTLALERAPRDREIAEDLCAALRHAERFGELTVILKMLAKTAPDDDERRAVLERLARVQTDELRDRAEALEVWRQIVTTTTDGEVLSGLREEAQKQADHERVDIILAREVSVEANPERRVELALERAKVLAHKLAKPDLAIRMLNDSIADAAAEHLPTLAYLEGLTEEAGEDEALARVLEMQVDLVPDTAQRHVLRRLADLYEGPLDDEDAAMRALMRWESVRTDEIDPRLQLIPYLAKRQNWEGLLSRLDRLVSLARDDREKWIRVINKAVEKQAQDDPKGGREGAARDNEMAWFFLELAERARSIPQRLEMVNKAVDRFDGAQQWGPAFAAAVQALKLGGPEEELLDRADRFALKATAVKKLDPLYDELTERADTTEARRALVLRHSRLLEKADRSSDALDRLLRVSALDPVDADLLDALELAAPRCERVEELFSAYEDRASMVGAGDRAVTLMLRAVRAGYRLERKADVLRFLAQAIRFSEGNDEQLELVEETAVELGRDALQQLVRVYEAAGSDTGTPPEKAADFLVRAARVMRERLGAEDAAFGFLKRALVLAPTAEYVLDEMEKTAVERELAKFLDALFEKMIAETMSKDVAAVLLRRRGRLLQRHLDRPEEAADAFRQLWAMRPDDPTVLSELRVCLIETGQIHELISATERQLRRTSDQSQGLQLMRDIAELWEEDVKNEWEALEAWKRVIDHSPDDARAREAIERLNEARRSEKPAPITGLTKALPDQFDEKTETDAADETAEIASPASDDAHLTAETAAPAAGDPEGTKKVTAPASDAPDEVTDADPTSETV